MCVAFFIVILTYILINATPELFIPGLFRYFQIKCAIKQMTVLSGNGVSCVDNAGNYHNTFNRRIILSHNGPLLDIVYKEQLHNFCWLVLEEKETRCRNISPLHTHTHTPSLNVMTKVMFQTC